MADDSSNKAGWRDAFVPFLRLLARPVRKAQGRGGIVIEAYRGYGTRDEIFLIGRVFRQSYRDPTAGVDDVRSNLRDIARCIRRRRIAGAFVTAHFGGAEVRVVTDRDGYFRIHLRPKEVPSIHSAWHPVALKLEADPSVQAQGHVYIPPRGCRFVVISDIDDTIMHTGVANKLKMLWRLFVADAESRVAFPGAAALCKSFHAGVSGKEGNPMLYVSRAPWGIYDMLDEFFRRHEIPVGPVLFLREWGLSWRHPLPRKAEHHKHELIGNMLALYRDLPFVLIGDSGQHDPEVYAQVVADHPGRVLAVYIRNVSRDAERIANIERLATTVADAGSSLVLASDSAAMARHAAGLALIADDDCRAFSAESDTARVDELATIVHRISETTSAATSRTIADGALKGILEAHTGRLPNVVVEPADQLRADASSRAN